MLNLYDVKEHLRVDLDDDDFLIESLMDAATAATASYLDLTTLDATAPAPVKAAAMLLVADLYENRTAQVERPLFANATYAALLQPYRVMSA